jgi:prepilin-type N-terminal cleavage/methylation domain-containing protein
MTKVNGFTLLEMLLVISVIAVLSSIVIFNFRPADVIEGANNSARNTNKERIQKAIEAFIFERGGMAPTSLQSLVNSGYYDICKKGQSSDCVNLDELVSMGYLSDIPTDTTYQTTTTSGFKIEYDHINGEINIISKPDYNDIVSDSLISYWKLDETSPKSCAGQDVCDSALADLNGSWIGDTTNVNAKYNSGLQFDGNLDYVDFGSRNSIGGLSEASICTWIYYTQPSITTDGTIIGRYKDSDGEHEIGWLFWIDNEAAFSGNTDTVSFTTTPGNTTFGRVEGTTGLITPQIWEHYCGVFKGGQYIRIYKNGILNAESSISIDPVVSTNTNTNLTMGMLDNGNRALSAILDDVRIYYKALSDIEVQAVYSYTP